MNAIVTPLRAEAYVALVRRPRRKAHLASVIDGAEVWVTFCDRDIVVDGADVVPLDSPADAARFDGVCAHCYRMALVALVVQRQTRERHQAIDQAMLDLYAGPRERDLYTR